MTDMDTVENILEANEAAEALKYKGRTPLSIAWRQFRQHQMAIVGSIVLLILIFGAITVSFVTPYSSTNSSLIEMREPPSLRHPMGTDTLGRDLMTRIFYGARISIAIGLFATLLGVGLGILIGATAGFYGGKVDEFLMRMTDLFISLPRLFMLIIMAILLRNANAPILKANGNMGGIILILGSLSWTGVARLVRGQVLSLKEKEFVESARAIGAPNMRIIFRHILPNTATPIIVAATLLVARNIISESGLSFLGFGVQPPTPTWGNMLTSAQEEMLKGNWWMAFFPGLMIFLTVISINYIGDGLRDALDPRKIR
jgi:peptide/nickel transport system permease protein